MRCKNCMTEVEDGTLFCPECGARLDNDSDKTVVLPDEDDEEEVPSFASALTRPEPMESEPVKSEPVKSEPVKKEAYSEPETPVLEPAEEKAAPVIEKEPVHQQTEEDFAYCPNCGNRVEGDAAFCEFCGFDMRGETSPAAEAETPSFSSGQFQESQEFIYCPNCGQKAEAGSVYCEFCGARMDGQEEKNGAKDRVSGKSKFPMIPVIAGGAAAVVVIAAAGIFVLPRIFGGSSDGAPKELFYVKDESLYGVSLKNSKQEPEEYTDELGSPGIEPALNLLSSVQLLSEDGKYRFIVENVTYGSDYEPVYDLYYQRGSKEPERVDSDIEGTYILTDDNQLLYKKNGNLYVSDLKEKEKIDSDVNSFFVDESGKHVLWTVDEGDEFGNSIYYQDIAMKEEKTELESNARIVARNSDFSKILLNKEGTVYLVRDQGKGEKVVGDADSIYSVDLENETFFYSSFVESTAKAMDYVDDDMAAADAQIKEPVRSDYERQEPGSFGLMRTVVDDSYYDDQEKYREKESRDRLRESLADYEFDNSYTELYYVSKGEKTLVTDHLGEVLTYTSSISDSDRDTNKNFGSYLLYTKYETEDVRVKFSQISSVSDVSSKVQESMSGAALPFVYAGGQEASVDLEDQRLYDYSRDVKNNQIYVLAADQEDSSGEYDLVSISLDSGSLGSISEHDTEVNNIEGVIDGEVYYLKDLNDRSVGELYCNGENVLTDVMYNSLASVPDSSAVLCLTDPDRNGTTGTLTLLKKGKDEDLADGVGQYHAFGEKDIAMLSDYSTSRMRGDLSYYNGKETYTIDTDVYGFFY